MNRTERKQGPAAPPTRVGVVGCGVIGGILAAHLASAGHEVHVVDASHTTVEAINADGIRVEGIRTLHARPAAAHLSLDPLGDARPEFVFLCVKTTVIPRILDGLARLAPAGPALVCFQNGIDTELSYASVFPRERILRGVVHYAGSIVGPGRVRMIFFNPPNPVGAVAEAGRAAARKAAALLTAARLDGRFSPDIRADVWRKAILNCCMMPLSVVTRLTMNRILELPETRAIVERLLVEFLEVARAEGHHFGPDFLPSSFAYLQNAGDHKCSMLVDFEAGLPLELDALNGKMQEYAERHGIPCETNRLMLGIVKGLLLHRDLEAAAPAAAPLLPRRTTP
jgi:2-dehydropantoate 2-reductase